MITGSFASPPPGGECSGASVIPDARSSEASSSRGVQSGRRVGACLFVISLGVRLQPRTP